MIPNWNQFYPYSVELKDDALDFHEVKIQNPNYVKGRPAFSFGYTTKPAEQQFKKIVTGEKGNGVEKRNVQKLRQDLLEGIESPVSRGQAERHIEERADALRAKGNAVYLTDRIFGLIYWVYVIKLEEAASRNHKMIDANPNWEGTLPPFYVGMTGKSPSQRFDDHQKGKKGNQLVKDYGLKLRPDLYKNRNGEGLRSWEAEDMEVLIAEELRDEGYAIFQS